MADSKNQEGLNNILNAISNVVDGKVQTLKFDKTFRAKVTEKLSDTSYKVEINGIEYTLSYNGTLLIGDIVHVKSPLNNFSDIYIEPQIENSTSYDMLHSGTSTSANKYCLIAEYTLTGNFVDFSDVILINTSTSSIITNSTTINVIFRKGNTNIIQVNKIDYKNPPNETLKFYTVSNYISSTNTYNIKLYSYCTASYLNVFGKSLDYKYNKEANKTVTRSYYTDKSLETSLPSGIQVEAAPIINIATLFTKRDSYTISSGFGAATLTGDSFNSQGTLLTRSSAGSAIVIGDGVSKVLVSGSVQAINTGDSRSSGDKILVLRYDYNNITTIVGRAYSSNFNGWVPCSISPMIYNVESGGKFYLDVVSGGAGTVEVLSGQLTVVSI